MSNIDVTVSTKDLPNALHVLDYEDIYDLIINTDALVADSEFTETLIKRLVIALKDSLGNDINEFMVELNDLV